MCWQPPTSRLAPATPCPFITSDRLTGPIRCDFLLPQSEVRTCTHTAESVIVRAASGYGRAAICLPICGESSKQRGNKAGMMSRWAMAPHIVFRLSTPACTKRCKGVWSDCTQAMHLTPVDLHFLRQTRRWARSRPMTSLLAKPDFGHIHPGYWLEGLRPWWRGGLGPVSTSWRNQRHFLYKNNHAR